MAAVASIVHRRDGSGAAALDRTLPDSAEVRVAQWQRVDCLGGQANAECHGITVVRRISEKGGSLLPDPGARTARPVHIEAGSPTRAETGPYLPDPAVERSEAASSMD